MRFYNINSQGPLFINRGTGTPSVAVGDEGRIFYEDGNEEIFYEDSTAWIRMYSYNNLPQLIIDIDAQGAWIRKDQDDTTTFQLTVDGGIVGDVYASNGTSVILQNGSDGTNAYILGDVKAENTDTILFSGTDKTTSWASLESIKNTAGVDVLVTNTTIANSTFAGTANAAYYA